MIDDADVLAKMSLPAMLAVFGWYWTILIFGASVLAVAFLKRFYLCDDRA